MGDIAVIRTPWIRRSSKICVTFSYHMFGTYMGGLRMFVQEKNSDSNLGNNIKLWEKLLNQNNTWHTADITYTPLSKVEVRVITIQ